MGYCSEIVLVINKECYLQSILLNDLPELLKEVAPTSHNNGMYWRFSDYKWYPEYESVQEVHTYLEKLELPNDPEYPPFGFIRVGEGSSDIEELGDPYEYDISVYTKIEAIV